MLGPEVPLDAHPYCLKQFIGRILAFVIDSKEELQELTQLQESQQLELETRYLKSVVFLCHSFSSYL